MNDTRPSRRRFLQSVVATAGGAASIPLARELFRTERAFGAQLDGLRTSGDPSWSPQDLRDRYMLDPSVVYLNHASIGTVPRAVHEAHTAYLAACESNPWLYMWGGAWEEGREAARASLATLVGAGPDDVAITHNTTEGFNLLARGLPLGPGDEVLFSTLNHAGASVCFDHVAAEKGYSVRRFELDPLDAAAMTPDELMDAHVRAVRPATRLLVLPHVDNVVGVRHPLEALGAAVRRRGVRWVAADGAQTVGMLPLDLPASGVDFYAGSPHKWVQSPKGLGLLYVRAELRDVLRPMWVTWGQDRWEGTVRVFEDYGTRNLPAVLALGDAADFQIALGGADKVRRYRRMRENLRERVEASPGLRWRSPTSFDDGASLVAIEVTGRSAPELAETLWREHGVVLRAFGGELDTLRVSPNVVTADEELERFAALLETAAR
jgi:selenocysteine lyase/cysteine desulfurase